MLTPYDISVMESDVRDIIDSWNCKVVVLNPLPLNQQTNYNTLMDESTGNIQYDVPLTVNAEIKNIQNMEEDINKFGLSGHVDDGTIMITINDGITIDVNYSIIQHNGSDWRIKAIRYRIGEKLLLLEKNTGGGTHV